MPESQDQGCAQACVPAVVGMVQNDCDSNGQIQMDREMDKGMRLKVLTLQVGRQSLIHSRLRQNKKHLPGTKYHTLHHANGHIAYAVLIFFSISKIKILD